MIDQAAIQQAVNFQMTIYAITAFIGIIAIVGGIAFLLFAASVESKVCDKQ